jgi:DNA repair protein RadD
VDRQRRVKAQAPSIAEKLSFQRQLRFIERERGYRPGWTAHKFREKFGHWPARNDVEPLPPDATTRAWVRSQQIAYARVIARGSP